jgi:hypothetical protein
VDCAWCCHCVLQVHRGIDGCCKQLMTTLSDHKAACYAFDAAVVWQAPSSNTGSPEQNCHRRTLSTGTDGWCETWPWGGVSKHVGGGPLDLLHRHHAIIPAPSRQPDVLVPSCASPYCHTVHRLGKRRQPQPQGQLGWRGSCRCCSGSCCAEATVPHSAHAGPLVHGGQAAV